MTNLLALLRSSITAFLGWWGRELVKLVPRPLRERERRERCGFVLMFGRQNSVVLERAVGGERELGSVETDAPDHDQRLSELLKQAKCRRRPVTVRLREGLGLRKVLDLPLAAKNDLDRMLRFEMDRLTPFRADEVYFAHRILGSGAQDRQLLVELQLAPKREIERVLETAEGFGIAPARVELAVATEGADTLNLLPGQPGHEGRERRLNRLLALIALILSVSAIAISLQRQRAIVAELETEVSSAKARAEESLALRDRLAQVTRSAQFLVANKNRHPLVIEVLDELTRLVPDQAYLVQFELQNQTVELQGLAATASHLIGLLEKSPLFKAPQFRSPVTQDRRSGAERFHVSVELASKEGG